MKIAFLFKKDSHFKAVKSTALRLCAQYNCEPIFIGVDSEYFPIKERHSVIYIGIQDLTSLFEYDYVIACLGGYLLNHVVSALRHTNTKVISIFPGIVSHYQFDAFISRLNADQVWLNSRADYDLYNKICRLLKCSNNSILYGMSWIDLSLILKSKSSKEKGSGNIVFFEQTGLFLNAEEKLYFKRKLSSIFSKNIKLNFKYKIRDNTNNVYFKELRQSFSKHINVDIVEELTDIDTLDAEFYLSISSSAIVEGLLYRKYCFLIAEELIDKDSLEFFRNSKLFLNEDTLIYEDTVDETWLDYRVQSPKKYMNLYAIKKKLPHRFIKRNWIACYLLLALSLSKLKFINFIFDKEKKKSIVKSIDYLNLRSDFNEME